MKKLIFSVFFASLFILNCGVAMGALGLDDSGTNDKKDLLMGVLGLALASGSSSSNLEIDTTVPGSWEEGVSIRPIIYVKFKTDLDSSTITTDNIKLMEGATEFGISLKAQSTNSILITPVGDLRINTSYTVKLLTGLKDSSGLALGEEYNWSFTTSSSEADSGSVITFAGSGTAGNADGTGTAASFNGPQYLVGELYGASIFITDTGNHRIRKIVLSSQVVTTVAGSTSGYTAGTGVAARFNSPKGIFLATISGVTYYFVSDSGNNGSRKMTAAYVVSNTYGTNTNAAGFVIANNSTSQRYRNPEGFAVDLAIGHQYIADTGNHCIRRANYAGQGVSNSASNTTCFAGANPSGGIGTAGFTNGANTLARFNNPKGLAVDNDGNIYVADSGNHSIRIITPSGVVGTIAGNGTSGYANGLGSAARFSSPAGIVSDGANTLYVTDTGNCAIRKLTLSSDKSTANVSTFAGANTDVTSGNCSLVNGTRLTSRFNSPKGLWRDSNGNLYITDTGNNVIRKISP